MVGQLAWLEWCNEWKGLGRQGGAVVQEWLECMKLSLDQAIRLLMGKQSAPTNTGNIMVSICY